MFKIPINIGRVIAAFLKGQSWRTSESIGQPQLSHFKQP